MNEQQLAEIEARAKYVRALEELIMETAIVLDPDCPDIDAYLDGHCSLVVRARESQADNAKLREQLQEAGELAEEAVGYVSPYFRDKWNMDERLRNVRGALKWTGPP
ncbi:MAG: hypothetical protein V1755_13800 [Chloroflexota bacterium]